MTEHKVATYDWVRVGRATRDVKFDDPYTSVTIDVGSLNFDVCSKSELQDAIEVGHWQRKFERADGSRICRPLTYEYVGGIELPRSMIAVEAMEWVENNEKLCGDFYDEQIRSDTTVEDFMEVIR